mmetsp:Transcript_23225/g.59100  ORF Transcript_23225/g.59100 Transcript_23225/m.59100 type:complete len:301 (+) Transcript_23225:799-1701(+)
MGRHALARPRAGPHHRVVHRGAHGARRAGLPAADARRVRGEPRRDHGAPAQGGGARARAAALRVRLQGHRAVAAVRAVAADPARGHGCLLDGARQQHGAHRPRLERGVAAAALARLRDLRDASARRRAARGRDAGGAREVRRRLPRAGRPGAARAQVPRRARGGGGGAGRGGRAGGGERGGGGGAGGGEPRQGAAQGDLRDGDDLQLGRGQPQEGARRAEGHTQPAGGARAQPDLHAELDRDEAQEGRARPQAQAHGHRAEEGRAVGGDETRYTPSRVSTKGVKGSEDGVIITRAGEYEG